MPQRKADAIWNGDLKGGKGTMKFGSGAFEGSYSFASRFEEGTGTNPEELIGAAHAGCYSMALSNELAQAGFTPESVETTANVTLDAGAGAITKINLKASANVPGIDSDKFHEIANGAKENCPVSKALAGVEITLDASLKG
jgi:osmotically inducible protein OsmC